MILLLSTSSLGIQVVAADQDSMLVTTCKSTNKDVSGRGCCSWHNGQCGCRNGKVICCDGTESPTCECLSVSDDQEVLIIDSKTIEIEKSEIKIKI